MAPVKRLVVAALVVVVVAASARLAVPARAQAGWQIDDMAIDYTIRPDGTLVADESIQVNFGGEPHHGIIRDLATKVECTAPREGAQPPLTPCPGNHDRVYDIRAIQVTSANGKPLLYSTSESDGMLHVKIGDPDVTVTGKQSYSIHYEVRGALDAYSDHDELYWNATGTWPATIAHAVVTVRLPAGASLKTTCYEGLRGIDRTCRNSATGSSAKFEASRPLGPSEQLTIVAGWPRGLVQIQPPVFEKRLTVGDFFTFDWIEFTGLVLVAVSSIAAIVALWWNNGRDRRYRTLYYLTNDPSEHTQPLFGHTDVVVEYLPPDDLRPAQMGVILDERADTRDVTATIIDLAVRGYLHITEIPKEGWFGHKDWKLTKVERESDLLPYEQELYDSLFEGSKTEVELSDLKNTFASKLAKVKDELYDDAMKRKWFTARPGNARVGWLLAGLAFILAGALLSLASGILFSRALIFTPAALAGVLWLPVSRAMARRTATGSEALRRVLGFRLYVATAETRMQEFNEQQNIFARYLPFAIVFGCVDKWAKAFKGIEDQAQASTSSWYTGTGAFEVMAFSAGLQGFASSVTTTMASTPGSSGGGSGFSGGFSGGGGGGGGGGAW